MFEARQKLIDDIAGSLADILTASESESAKGRLESVLNDYIVQYDPKQSGPDDLLEIYLSALSIEGKSPLTIKRYQYLLGKMIQAIGQPASRISVYDLRHFLANEKARGLNDSTLEGTRQIISAFYNWLLREGLIKSNPAANLGAIKTAKVLRQAFTDIELERLKRSANNARDRAIILFLAATGCRISEMISLNRSDVDLNRLECVVRGKGNKERTVYLTSVAAMALKEYFSERNDDSPALFAGHGSERIMPGAVRIMLNKAGERAGVDHVHPHKFRRTLATNLIKHGMKIEEVASILGHDKLDTTMGYVVLYKENVKNAYQRYA